MISDEKDLRTFVYKVGRREMRQNSLIVPGGDEDVSENNIGCAVVDADAGAM